MTEKHKSSLKYIIASQYFLYFGVFGIFLPYFNLYCYHIGFTGFQIGALSALRSVTLVFFSLAWGVLADRLQIRRPIYILCNVASAFIWFFYLFTENFFFMLIITAFYGIFYAPIISFLEAFSMDVLGKEKQSYGRLRMWGSISFILVVISLGKIIDLFSVSLILVLILAGSLMQASISFKIPNIKISKKDLFSPATKSLLNTRVIIFLFCAFLMLVSHGTYYGFFSIHLENLGYSNTFIGISWAIASTAEIFLMLNSDRIFKTFSPEKVLILSFIAAALRWFILFFATSETFILISQLLHAVTYGTFHMASILYIDLLSPDKNKTLGQAVNNAATYGLGLMVGFFLNGYLYESMDTSYLFIISSLIAIAGGVIFKGFHLLQYSKNRGLSEN
ncbi:MAG: MFS transporter [Deltaproteobacteria bacterium]|nr:MFS transporter [Deltaproteobacteria bacterium]